MEQLSNGENTLKEYTRNLLKKFFTHKICIKMTAARQRVNKINMSVLLPSLKQCISGNRYACM